jgi:hypothetical protein
MYSKTGFYDLDNFDKNTLLKGTLWLIFRCSQLRMLPMHAVDQMNTLRGFGTTLY